jgi:hypothetical protein|uniref:Lipoprotein n=1 Tax=Hydrogenobacter sp. TaxID=2152829 RepID=A0A7C2ZH96_9AQUI
MVRKIAFGGLFALLAIFFLSACAPTICPEGDKIKKNYSEQSAPYSYQVNLSLRQGFLRIPLQVQKTEGKFTISGEGKVLDLSLNNMCLGGMCFELPINPDGLIFGKVIRGDEKLSCGFNSVSFERDEGMYRTKYIFKDGKLSLVEFYDTKKNKTLRLNYLDWSKEGYVKVIRIEGESFSFLLTVDSLKF